MSNIVFDGSPLGSTAAVANLVNFTAGKQRKKSLKHPSRYSEKRSVSSKTATVQFTAEQAESLKALVFSGRRFNKTSCDSSPAETLFIKELSQNSNSDERIGVVEMLGRAKSINALPELLSLLNKKEAVQLRIAAVNAVGKIGESTHEDGFTRTSIVNRLVKFYKERKKEFLTEASETKEKLFTGFLQEDERKKLQPAELKAILTNIGKLNSSEGSRLLQEEYIRSFGSLTNAYEQTEEILQALKVAQNELINGLEREFKKPFDEIEVQIREKALKIFKSQIRITLGDGSVLRLQDIKKLMGLLKIKQECSAEILTGAMNGLAHNDSNPVNNYLKMSLNLSTPVLKAKALRILGERNKLSYNSDIYPNLKSNNLDIKMAALEALLNSTDTGAKQKTIELMDPKSYFNLMESALTKESLGRYVEFLDRVALDGDKYIHLLRKTLLNQDFDLQTRKMVLLVLSSMSQEPFNQEVSAETEYLARDMIKAMALSPIGQSQAEKESLALMALKLWVSLGEFPAIAKAFSLLGEEAPVIPVEDQEKLLIEVYQVLKKDFEDNNVKAKHAVLGILAGVSDPIFNKEALNNVEDSLKPSLKKKLLSSQAMEEIYNEYGQDSFNIELINKGRKNLNELRPILLKLLDHEGSPTIRMVTAQIIGFLKDNNEPVIEKLIENTRDPLRGLLDWSRDPSLKGIPSTVGGNIRVNNIMALGNIGSSEAMDLMLDALDEPTLRPYVLDPLGQLAGEVNKGNNPESLKRVSDKLLRIITTPNPSRAVRALRLKAGNALFQYNGGINILKQFIETTSDPNFKRQALSIFVSNNYALEPDHPDHSMVKDMLQPELGVEEIHKVGITGKDVGVAVIDGSYVDKNNRGAFQDRIRVPAFATVPDDDHPTMVASVLASDGKIKGVAPDAIIYSDVWPDFDGEDVDPMENYKKIIEGKIRGENNVRVINNSWGFTDNNIIIIKDVRNLLKEFKRVVDMGEKAGIQMVFAAGNNGEKAGIPTLGSLSLFGIDVDKLTGSEKKDLDYILDKVILVGASNTQGLPDKSRHSVSDFSSLGDSLNHKLIPTVLAPGVDMLVYGYNGKGGNPKELVNGTSFASPYISGLLALMFGTKPELTPAEARDIIKSTAVKLPNVPDTYQGHGEVDPKAAIEKVLSLTSSQKAKPVVKIAS